MSIILDALKKSQQQRQQQQVPGLHSQPEPVAAPPRRRLWPLLLSLALLLNGAVGLWWLLRAAPPQGAALQTTSPHNSTTGAVPPPAPVPVVTAPEVLTPPAPTPATQRVTPPPLALPAPTATAAESGPNTKTDASRQPQPTLPPAPAAEPGHEGLSADQPADLPLYQQLPGELLERLPTLDMSVHVYSTDPASRLVRINNQLLGEGSRIDSCQLEEITPQGAVLRQGGTRFLLPRRGQR